MDIQLNQPGIYFWGSFTSSGTVGLYIFKSTVSDNGNVTETY
jgi:hypothetical protein